MSDATPFRLEEATIDSLHAAIRAGDVTVVQVVQHYLDRARAFNGVASVLMTADGADVPPATGAVRATAPLHFPTHTVQPPPCYRSSAATAVHPLEYGRMEATASDRPSCSNSA